MCVSEAGPSGNPFTVFRTSSLQQARVSGSVVPYFCTSTKEVCTLGLGRGGRYFPLKRPDEAALPYKIHRVYFVRRMNLQGDLENVALLGSWASHGTTMWF